MAKGSWMKVCSKCGQEKSSDEFNKRTLSKDGLTSACRECLYVENAKYREAHREDAKERSRIWREQNPERRKATLHDNYCRNRERRKMASRKWRSENRERHIDNVRRWRVNHPEETKQYARITGQRIRATVKGRLNANIKRYIAYSLHGTKRGRHWETLVGYTVDQLKTHLEKLFKPGMTWENYGTAWHIDHKVPIVAFNFKSPDELDFNRCWALKNLRPMWATQNISKGAKLEKPFQPSLVLAI
ncbi:MAG: hypothetical protein PHC90_14735 [Syntrophorhabdaceae bacterium]|jgi:hypothetical protein|nr:hypothetical protein [Syntrophorhabdaceae bacterium]